MKRLLFFFFLLLSVSTDTFAQGETSFRTVNWLTGNLKIFVSVIVLAIILLLIFSFLFWTERRLKNLENK